MSTSIRGVAAITAMRPATRWVSVALRETTGDGVADVRMRFGDSVRTGGIGGTGIGLHAGTYNPDQ